MLPALLAWLAERGRHLASLTTRHASLDDVFVTADRPATRARRGGRRHERSADRRRAAASIRILTLDRWPGSASSSASRRRSSGSTSFPLVLVVALGVAFRNRPVETFRVAVEDGRARPAVVEALERRSSVSRPSVTDEPEARLRLAHRPRRPARRRLAATGRRTYDYTFDPDAARERAGPQRRRRPPATRAPAAATPSPRTTSAVDEPGGRYIDFLVPGLLGMGLMGGGLWGVGFAIVDMRIRKLLKRYLATPMRRSHFLAAVILSRLVFTLPEVAPARALRALCLRRHEPGQLPGDRRC